MLKQGVSIIVCCYNSSKRIRPTLEHLANQQLDNIDCEIILVDNASSDETGNIANLIWSEIKNTEIDFRLLFEKTPGVAFARKKAVNEAMYEYLVFCDDDNWLEKDYIQKTFYLFKSNPNVGVLGGIGTAVFEYPHLKPAWFDDFYHGYAVGPQAENEGIVNAVYGAGMALRTSILKGLIDKIDLFLLGRKQNHLSAGEDAEILLRIRLVGYKILYSPQLTFKHFITNKRLTWPYLKKLYIGFAHTNVIITIYEKAMSDGDANIPYFYWLKKGMYYCGIYLKYWPKHFSKYRRNEGTIDEIHHITWKYIAFSYFRYNFKTVKIYNKIVLLKKAYV